MDDLERKLAALGRLDVESNLPPVQAIARRARLRRGTAATISLAAAVVVAIGGYAGVRALATAEPRAVAPAVLTDAVLTTQDEGTARTELDMTIHTEAGGFSNDQEVHGTGVIDFDAGLSRFVSENPLFPGARPVEVIQDGTTVYQRGSPDDPDQWFTYEMAGSSSGLFASDKGPDDYLGTLRAVSGPVESLGEEELDGVIVTHYQAIIDPELFLQELASWTQLENRLDEVEVELEPAEVWIDEQGRVRRMDLGWVISLSGDEWISAGLDSTSRFFDFGVAVDIEIPDPQDVVETPPPFVSPSPEPDSGSQAALVVGDEGVAQPHLGVDRRAGGVCFFEGPAFAASATVEHEPTGEDLVTFEEAEIFADYEAEEARGCDLEVSKRDISDLLESPSDYLLRIGGGSPPRVVYLTEVVTDP